MLHQLGGSPTEMSQCLIIHLAAGYLLHQAHAATGVWSPPSVADALALASQWRTDVFLEATAFTRVASAWEGDLTAVEAEVTMHAHDWCTRDHPKDWKSVAVFLIDDLAPFTINVLRVDRGHSLEIGRAHV